MAPDVKVSPKLDDFGCAGLERTLTTVRTCNFFLATSASYKICEDPPNLTISAAQDWKGLLTTDIMSGMPIIYLGVIIEPGPDFIFTHFKIPLKIGRTMVSILLGYP